MQCEGSGRRTLRLPKLTAEAQPGALLCTGKSSDQEMFSKGEQVSNSNWSTLAQLQSSETIVTVTLDGPATSRTGKFCGAYATIEGERGFIPFSELGLKRKPEELAGMEVPVKVIESVARGPRGRRLLLSRTQAVSVLQTQRLDELDALAEPRLVEGKVISLDDFGALVDLGNEVIGLAHRTLLHADRSKKPADVLRVGDAAKFAIVSIDRERMRVGLSLRAVAEPEFVRTFEAGTDVIGTVARTTERGVFVDLGGCVDGFLRADKLPKGTAPDNAYTVGEKYLFRVTFVDPERGFIRLRPARVASPQPEPEVVLADFRAGAMENPGLLLFVSGGADDGAGASPCGTECGAGCGSDCEAVVPAAVAAPVNLTWWDSLSGVNC